MKWAALVVSALAFSGAFGVYHAATARHEAGDPGSRELAHLIPDYPDSQYHAASDGLHVEGKKRFMAYAMTDDRPSEVLERYHTMFEQRGLAVTAYDGGLVAWATDDDWLRSVAVGDGLIVVSVTHRGEPKHKTPLPMPATCTVDESFGARDNGVTREQLSLRCDGFVSDVLDYYDNLMAHAELMSDSTSDVTVRSYESRTGEHMTLVAQQMNDSPPTTGISIYWEAQ